MLILCLLGLFFSLSLQGELIPDFDKRCEHMRACPPDNLHVAEPPYFDRPIPKKIHQIWFGDPSKMPKEVTSQWKEFSEHFGYKYQIWTEADDAQLRGFMKPENYQQMLQYREKKVYCSASDILRYELLRYYGGIYVDCDIPAPKDHGAFVDLALFIPLRGLVLTTEWHGRNIGTCGLFASCGLIMSCPHHPVIEQLVKSIPGNIESFINSGEDPDSMFLTGPCLLNKVLTGSFTIVPSHYLEKFYR
ncbi:MAG: hypothetical protein LLG04_11465 [Parachlamydia sp.]|nr:hypothetical protein [Parachlamydia sp.]